jgi:hypothetical protein
MIKFVDSVNEPPTAQISETQKNAFTGDNFELRCKITGSPQPSIVWLFNDAPVNNLANVYARGDVLAIRDARIDMSGYFTCRAVSPTGQYAQDSSYVRVSERVELDNDEENSRPEYPEDPSSSNRDVQIEITPRQANANQGETLRFHCLARSQSSSSSDFRYLKLKEID